MRFVRAVLGWMCVLVAFQSGWTQANAEAQPLPSLDPQQIKTPFVPGELIVGLEPGVNALPMLVMEMVGGVAAQIPAIDAYLVKLAPEISMPSAGEFLRAIPGVRYVEPNYKVFAFATPNDPSFGQQYGLNRIQAHLAWDLWLPQRTVYIAIIDSGIDYNHPDLANKIRRHSNGAIYGYDAFNVLGWSQDFMDYAGHGTHCAGIAAAEINNGIGVAGVAAWNPAVANSHSYVQLMPVKVLDEETSGTVSTIANGISWAASNGAHILSMSLGTLDFSTAISDAVNYAASMGCVLVAAAGNFASSAPAYPAHHSQCIAVAATDANDQLTSWSQYGHWIDIAAPGQAILSTLPGGGYESWSGTSMACPYVSGAAAILWSYNPYLTSQQVRDALETNVDPYTPYDGRTIGNGKGRLNVYRALLGIGAGSPPSLSSLSLSPTTVLSGNTSTGTVTLTGPAPSGGFVVNLSSSNTAAATVPSSVTVPAGSMTTNFTVSAQSVSVVTSVTITASAGSVSRQATLTVNPASTSVTLDSLTIQPTSVIGGRTATGTVRLTAPAPAGGAVVQLRSSSTRASVPSSVTVPAGATSANFTITTRSARTITTVTITATYNGVSRSAQLTIGY
ncbi:MAG: S8 family serine peptidase [Fimbriimonadales bacterium]|nr:S8 family serine peptidase [Fimbriimonadales bacterium]